MVRELSTTVQRRPPPIARQRAPAADNVATPLGFNTIIGGPVTATVNAAPNNKAWDDLSPNFGGLGVGTGSPSDSDQIALSDVLILSFTKSGNPYNVTLTGVGTLFDSGHTPFGGSWPNPTNITGSLLLIFCRWRCNLDRILASRRELYGLTSRETSSV